MNSKSTDEDTGGKLVDVIVQRCDLRPDFLRNVILHRGDVARDKGRGGNGHGQEEESDNGNHLELILNEFASETFARPFLVV